MLGTQHDDGPTDTTRAHNTSTLVLVVRHRDTTLTQRLSCAAAIEDAKIINRGARVLRQRATRTKGAAA